MPDVLLSAAARRAGASPPLHRRICPPALTLPRTYTCRLPPSPAALLWERCGQPAALVAACGLTRPVSHMHISAPVCSCCGCRKVQPAPPVAAVRMGAGWPGPRARLAFPMPSCVHRQPPPPGNTLRLAWLSRLPYKPGGVAAQPGRDGALQLLLPDADRGTARGSGSALRGLLCIGCCRSGGCEMLLRNAYVGWVIILAPHHGRAAGGAGW